MLRMGSRTMQKKQQLIYGARIRLGWFMEAKRLGSVTEACKRLGVPRRTYYYWYNRWKNNRKTLKSLMDQPRTPKSHKNDPNEDLVSLVIQLRLGLMYGENQLQIILLRDYGVNMSVHGIHNILSRAGLLEKRKKKVRKDRKLNDYPYRPGELMQMDVKHWKRTAYQYDIIDCCTRIKFKFIYKYCNANVTVDFLEKAAKFYAPAFKIKCIQTDNGTEFTNNQLRENWLKKPKLSPAEKWCEAHGIKVKHIPPSSPNLNGRIERPHGVDKWRYKKITTSSYTFEELREFCEDDCLDYNTYRPHSMLRNMTPVEFLQSLEGYKTAYPDFSVLY